MRSRAPSKVVFDQGFVALVARLESWTIPEAAIDRVHDAAKLSLNEVKALTEYEDGKVSRLLTVIAFLSAVVGAVFTRFASTYPWPGFSTFACQQDWFLPALTYATFFTYVVLVTSAVFIVLGAIRPTFNVPATWSQPGKSGLPTSMLFYEKILGVSAEKWGQAFETLCGDKGLDLKRYYAKCYIAEAYLVAEKVAEKLAALEPGIQLLRLAMGILVAFFVLFGATLVMVAPKP